MAEQIVTVRLPEAVLHKLQRAAELTYRSIDEVLASAINATLVAPPDLPADLADELSAMHLLSDMALWAATLPALAPADHSRLRQLNQAAGARDLSPAEEAEQAALLAAYHRSVLRRAQALAILKQRGHLVPADNAPGVSPDAQP